ncbi:hypothetical protein [Spirosoma agri]|uniref:Uncharacterized protein n=1 Tax=Spirosoma agri TaxID=1987381 RepID=A0A6M0IQB2_9BACT|nr:hypothetical protein [Spirosoma agri]NEU70520.1 hypothetical protein [Spirosoma agri]
MNKIFFGGRCRRPIRIVLRAGVTSVRLLLDTVYVLGLAGLFVMAVSYLAADTYNPFIYFRF